MKLEPGRGPAQDRLEALPVLPDVVPVSNMKEHLMYPEHMRTGFKHRNGEFQFLFKHDGKMYRLPESMAILRAKYEEKFTVIGVHDGKH
jgi:hypothetical protein